MYKESILKLESSLESALEQFKVDNNLPRDCKVVCEVDIEGRVSFLYKEEKGKLLEVLYSRRDYDHEELLKHLKRRFGKKSFHDPMFFTKGDLLRWVEGTVWWVLNQKQDSESLVVAAAIHKLGMEGLGQLLIDNGLLEVQSQNITRP